VQSKPPEEKKTPVTPQTVEPEKIEPETAEPEAVEPEPRPDAPKVTETAPEKPKTVPEVKPVPDKPAPQSKVEGGKILTQKKPYKVDTLLKEMQAMEDMMEDMRGKIRDYKKRK
jgi:hypothetical protein